MSNWYLTGIKYDKTREDGSEKKVTEYYLVDAVSFAEAEERIMEEMRAFVSGDMEVASIKKERLNETFFFDTGDKYYNVKINFITLDGRSGREKKTPAYMLAQASTIEEAKERFEESMKGTMSDYVVESIKETKIMDVFPYESGKEVPNG